MIANSGHDENGRYRGGKAGDQTGTEYAVIPWYSAHGQLVDNLWINFPSKHL